MVCRAFKKRTSSQNKSMEGWDSSYFYDELHGVSSIVDPTDFISRQPQRAAQSFLASQSFLCKQEIAAEADNLNSSLMPSDHFIQLPQLESPSLPLIKRPSSSMSQISSSENNVEEDIELINNKGYSSNINGKKTAAVTDWRDLDKFVASQLSQEDNYNELGDHGDYSSFGVHDHDDSDMAALLLLQRDEGNRLNGFLSSSSDCDLGICIFEK